MKKGTIGHEMYLIGHGTVIVHAGEHIIAQLESGQCFGEMALIVEEPRGADVTTTTYCDLFVLSKAHFHELMAEFPELRANAEKMVADRQANAKKPAQKAS